jgi:hypothetical protein
MGAAWFQKTGSKEKVAKSRGGGGVFIYVVMWIGHRWTYKVAKKYDTNKGRPKGCLAAAYMYAAVHTRVEY